MSSAAEMGQGRQTLSRAAGLVAGARADLDGLSRRLDGQVAGLQGQWTGSGGSAFLSLHRAWTERQATITGALDSFEAALRATERDNLGTDEAQSAHYRRTAARLGG